LRAPEDNSAPSTTSPSPEQLGASSPESDDSQDAISDAVGAVLTSSDLDAGADRPDDEGSPAAPDVVAEDDTEEPPQRAPQPAPAESEDPRLVQAAAEVTVTPEMVTAFKAENPAFATMDDATAGSALKDIIASAIIEQQDTDAANEAAGEPSTGAAAAPYSLWSDLKSIPGGIASGIGKAGFEAYDLVNEDVLSRAHDPSEWRQGIEKYYDGLHGVSGAAAVIAQWGITFVGVGKFAKLAGLAKAGTKLGVLAQGAAKGAAADFIAFDGMQGRLSDIVQQYPALENPVTEFLSTKPDDGDAVGRLKNALEGLGIGATVDTVLAGFKALRAAKAGDKEAINAAVDEGTESYAKVAKEPDVADATQPPKTEAAAPDAEATARPASESLESQPRSAEEPPTAAEAPAAPEAPPAPRSIPTVAREELDKASKGLAQKVLDDPAGLGITTPDVAQPVPSTFDSITRADDLKAVIDNVEKEILAGIEGSNSSKGPIAIAETQRLAKQLAEDTGQDPGEFFVRMSKDSDNMQSLSARVLAYDQVTRTMATRLRDMAQAIKQGIPGQFGTMEALKDAFEGQLASYAQVQDWLKGVRSETGRTLNILRHSRTLGPDINTEALAAFGQGRGAFGGQATVEELADAVLMAGTDRKMLGKIANPTKYAMVRDALVSLFVRNILSGPTTHLVNVIGNVSAALTHPASKILGGVVERDGTLLREGVKQYGFMLAETTHALRMAIESYRRGINILDPVRSKFAPNGVFEEKLTASKITGGVVPDDSVTGWLANGMFKGIDAVSTRALSASDEFFKQTLYASELTARAWADGVAQGLEGDALKAFIKRQRDAGFTLGADGRQTGAADIAGNANAEAALNVARFGTFSQGVKPGSIAGEILKVTNKHPELKFAVPFVRVVSNILDFTGSMTPGIAGRMSNYKDAIARGGREAAIAKGRLALGYAVWTTAVGLAASGHLTGAGPVKSDGSPDYKRRTLLMQTGWKPNALKIGDAYIDISRMDPFGLPFNIAAQAMEKFQAGMKDDKSWLDIATAMSFSVGHALLDRQYLKGLADLMEALNDDTGRKASSYAANLFASVVVPNFVKQVATANADPLLREARGVVEQIMKRTPFASESLAAKRMPWGAKMEGAGPLDALVSPTKDDPLMREYARLLESGDSGGGEPLPRMKTVPGGRSIDLASTRLSNGELLYDVYGDLIEQPDPSVPPLTAVLKEMIESDSYKHELVDGPGAFNGTRLKAWQTIMARYRAAAWRVVLERFPEVRERVYGPRLKAAEAAQEHSSMRDWLNE